MTQVKTDLLVIGAGSGGLSVAAGASQMGADVTLLESGLMGGDCLNYGCVPSKALIAAGKAAHAAKTASKFGVNAKVDSIDYGSVMEHVSDVIATIAPHDSQERFEGMGVRVIREAGVFLGPKTVKAGDHEITARRIVIATGSRAFIPPIEGLGDVSYLTNETIFELRTAPKHLIVLGCGPIGMEMAQAHARLGIKTTAIEPFSVLGRERTEYVDLITQAMQEDGVSFVVGKKPVKIHQTKGGVHVMFEDGEKITGSHILVATGRRPNVDGLNLQAANIEYSDRGVVVDNRLRTTNKNVFAIGDVIGKEQFTHVAGYHAGLVVRQALLMLPAKLRSDHIPRVTFTDPEVAHVGLSPQDAVKQYGNKAETVTFSLGENDRAIADRKSAGAVEVTLYKGRVVGASALAYNAGELINFWSYMIANRTKFSSIPNMISPYPTQTEVNKRVIGAYYAPKLFDNIWIKRIVRSIQKWVT